MSRLIRYVVITPVRDEENYIGSTIQSMVRQTVLPQEWIIVNDGSSDRTGEIIDSAAREYPLIKTLHRKDRGSRKAGGGVIEAFYDGYSSIESNDWEFIVKLDGDLSFDMDYFEKCFEKFQDIPKLGIGGGAIFNLIDGSLVLEKHPRFHVRGATKIYRRVCWEAIGGLILAPGWDTLDEVKANMMGFETKTFFNLCIVHHRYTGAADGTWKDSVKNGLSDYISGYHPIFMLLKCLKRMAVRPFMIHAMGLMYGFMSGYARRVPQVDDRKLIEYIQREQIRKLLFKPSIWN
ncbi:MAG: glycosyltransferase family 2 protein [Deltaproteobacteria bacterium]|nr:glycosyltransferase family 2 protein [Deltaproteobacteria bacterium]MBM4321958.1 glycosyltransferase family 2 protein [Deltaproteobacteria bacterium]